MRNFVLGALATLCVFLAMGAARFVPSSSEASVATAVRKTFPIKLSELTLDRAFRFQFTPGYFSGNPTVIPFPGTVGIIITSIAAPMGNGVKYQLSVNGGPVQDIFTSVTATEYRLDPPVIVPPGGTLTIGDNGNIAGSPAVAVSGYYVFPGEV